jgi:AcrR family transcriptional regulator
MASARKPERRRATARRLPRAEWERRILESALETFGREGYGASVNRIIEDAGAPVGTFYRLFPDKDALFARLMADLHPGYVKRVVEAVGDVSDPIERLRATVEAMIVVGVREYGDVARLYFTDVRGRGSAADIARRVEEGELELLLGPIRDGLTTGALACADAELAAVGILGLTRKTVESYVLGRVRPSVAAGAQQAAALAVDGMVVR